MKMDYWGERQKRINLLLTLLAFNKSSFSAKTFVMRYVILNIFPIYFIICETRQLKQTGLFVYTRRDGSVEIGEDQGNILNFRIMLWHSSIEGCLTHNSLCSSLW